MRRLSDKKANGKNALESMRQIPFTLELRLGN